MQLEQRKHDYNILLLCINIANLIAFVLFSKFLMEISMIQFYIIVTIFGIIYIAYFVIVINLSKSAIQANHKKDCLQFMTIIKEMSLAVISFFYFTQLASLDTTSEFQVYYFLYIAIYFCIFGIFNCILIEKFLFVKELHFLEFLFLFIFRSFYFIARSIGLVLFMSSINDVEPNIFIYLVVPVYMLVLFSSYCIWYRLINKRSTVLQIAFESVKLLIDFNDKFFSNNRVLLSIRKFKIKINLISAVAFGIIQIIIQVSLAYFWFYKAYDLLRVYHNKTTLFSILSKTPTHISLTTLYQLRLKLKQRELDLVVILGSICISVISSFIYYNYYNEQIKEMTIYQSNTNSSSKCQINKQNDDFSISTNEESSSSLSTALFMRPRLKSFTLNRCSTCSSQESSAYLSRSFSELMVTPIKKNDQHRRRFTFNIESSSGVESSTNDSSSFMSDQLASSTFFETGITTTKGRIVGRNLFSEFTVDNLNEHNKQNNRDSQQPRNILSWVKQADSNDTYII